MINANNTECIQGCLFRFSEPIKNTSEQNNICLATAAIGSLILISGCNDLYRVCTNKKYKYNPFGNAGVILIALLKIAAGASFLGNAFTYDPAKWNSELFGKCQNFCLRIYKPLTAAPHQTVDPNPCCTDCDNDFQISTNDNNFGIGMGFGITLGITSTAKTVFNVYMFVKKWLKQKYEQQTVTLALRQWKVANTHFLQDLLEMVYAIAIYTFITTNTIGNDDDIMPSYSSMGYDLPTDYIMNKCFDYCQDLNLINYHYWCGPT
jgi:hypothetical protein